MSTIGQNERSDEEDESDKKDIPASEPDFSNDHLNL